MSRARPAIAALAAIWLAGCAGGPAPSDGVGRGEGGGYYQNDGPPLDTDIELSAIPNAVPRNEPLSEYGNPPSYEVFGETYYTLRSAAGFSQKGIASWYGRQFHGRRTSSGEPYNMYRMTAAHKTLPLPSYVRVTNLRNGKQVIVRVNDRGPFHDGRIIDLSYVAALKLGIVRHGSAPVRIETVTAEEITRPAAATGPRPPLDNTAIIATDHSALFLQVGAFADRDNARQLSNRLQRMGIRDVIITPRRGQTTLYRVRVGPFANPGVRHETRRELAAHGLPVRLVRN